MTARAGFAHAGILRQASPADALAALAGANTSQPPTRTVTTTEATTTEATPRTSAQVAAPAQPASAGPARGRARRIEPVSFALEDRLTALEATAPNDGDRTRARRLRDAVRAGRNRLIVSIAAGDIDTLQRGLDAAAAGVEVTFTGWDRSG